MNVSERKFLASQCYYGNAIALQDTLPVATLQKKYTDEEFSKLQEMHPEQDDQINPVGLKIHGENIMTLVRLSYLVADKMLEYDELTKDKAQYDLQKTIKELRK